MRPKRITNLQVRLQANVNGSLAAIATQETVNTGQGTGNQGQANGSQDQGTGNRGQENGSQEPETGNREQEQEIGSRKQENGSQGQETENGNLTAEVTDPRPESANAGPGQTVADQHQATVGQLKNGKKRVVITAT